MFRKLFVKKVKDPVCGMSVDPKTAISRTISGKTYYFCSEECANSYEEGKDKTPPSMGSNTDDRPARSERSSHDDEPHGCC